MKMKQTMKTIALAIVAIVTAWGGHIYAQPPTTIPDRGGSYSHDRGDSPDIRHGEESVAGYGIYRQGAGTDGCKRIDGCRLLSARPSRLGRPVTALQLSHNVSPCNHSRISTEQFFDTFIRASIDSRHIHKSEMGIRGLDCLASVDLTNRKEVRHHG